MPDISDTLTAIAHLRPRDNGRNCFDGMVLPHALEGARPLHRGIYMRVAVDIATYPVIRDGDFYYPAVASLLSILHAGGIIVIFKSQGIISEYEQLLLEKLAAVFRGRIIIAADGQGTDMRIS
jgi:hypothetical protein